MLMNVNLAADYGLIAVSGQEAAKFLQGQLTCDVQALSSSTMALGAFCNPKGRIRVLFRIIKNEPLNESLQDIQSFLLQLPKNLVNSTLTELKKYARFSKVNILDVSEEWIQLGVIGDDAIQNINKHIGTFDSNHKQKIIMSNFPGETPRAVVFAATALKSHFSVFFPHSVVLPHEDSLTPGATWKLLDIRLGLPQVYEETQEQFLVHHLNLPKLNAVSFTKGCYCGQEIVARMQYRGNIKRHMVYSLLCADPQSRINDSHLITPKPGTIVYNLDDQEIGTVITATGNEKDEVEMLVELQKDHEGSLKVNVQSSGSTETWSSVLIKPFFEPTTRD